jgi:23S rRNA (pseudouridine1915-N3)-methyltransferase
MKLLLTSIASRTGAGPAQSLLADYITRLTAYTPAEFQLHRTEQAFLESLAKHRARTQPWLVLLDSRGVQLSSEALATLYAAQQDSGRQLAIFAIGPPDGWSQAAVDSVRGSSGLLLSLGPMTLPHELARIVLAEQLYRACTILAGHPYHSGHTTP